MENAPETYEHEKTGYTNDDESQENGTPETAKRKESLGRVWISAHKTEDCAGV